MISKDDEPGTGSPGPGGPGYPQTKSPIQESPGAGGDDYPHNTAQISEFAKRTRELGQYLDRQVLDRAREPVSPEDREAMIQWTLEAKKHTAYPESLDADYLLSDRPLDYFMMNVVYQQHTDLVRDRD